MKCSNSFRKQELTTIFDLQLASFETSGLTSKQNFALGLVNQGVLLVKLVQGRVEHS